MTNEPSADGNKSITSRRSFLKSTGAIAGPVVFSETVRSASNGGRPLVLEVKTGYRLPDGLPKDNDIRPPLSATCSPSSYHVAGDRLQVTPTASEEEVATAKNENVIVISDGIAPFSPPIWGDTETRLRLNPELGARQVSSLDLDGEVRSPQVRLQREGDAVQLPQSDGRDRVGTQQAGQRHFPIRQVKVPARRYTDTEPTGQDDGPPSASQAPTTEPVQLTVEAVPEVHVRNHGKLDVEKLSIGDATK